MLPLTDRAGIGTELRAVEFPDPLDVPSKRLAVLSRRLQDEGDVLDGVVVYKRAHPGLADQPLADVRVFVLVRSTVVLRVVEVDALDMLKPDGLVEFRERLVNALGGREVVARGEEVGGVETDVEIQRTTTEYARQFLDAAPEFRSAAGVGFDEHRHAVGYVEFLKRRGGVVETALDARAGVRTQMNVDVGDVEFRGRVDLGLHRGDGLLSEVFLWRTEIDEIGTMDDPRVNAVFGGALAEPLGLLVADVWVLPDLWGVGEYLPAVAVVLELFLDRVVDASGDGGVGTDPKHTASPGRATIEASDQTGQHSSCEGARYNCRRAPGAAAHAQSRRTHRRF